MTATRAPKQDAGAAEPTVAGPVVTVDHLRKTYGAGVGVQDVSFQVNQGEIFGIIGPNGAGKTTTVECVCGLRIPDSGVISVLGLDPQAHRAAIRERVGVQLQESALPLFIKVGEAVELFASFYRQPADPAELMDALGLAAKRGAYFRRLSGGLKQRLSIALALIGNPRIAILDELTTGLDPQARRDTWALIEHVRDRGVTVILVTHFMDEAERLCDRVMLIDRGAVAALDTPRQDAPACQVRDVTEPHAREAARLRTATGRPATITATGAVVAAFASTCPSPLVLTSDPRDLAALCEHAARPITIARG
jgi:ABC-2 type transport system ATP-binding protein